MFVFIAKPNAMKNEPVVTYNHMEEDESSSSHELGRDSSPEKNNHPISLYMILIVDVILICGVIYIAVKTIF
jgi:hypothetical protein